MKKPRSIFNKTLVLATAASLVAVASQASASVFFSDSFAYPDGELTINDGAGDDVSGGLWIPHSGQNYDDNLMVSNHELIVRASGSEDAHREAGVTMGAGETWYYGIQFSVMDTRTDPTTEAINNDYFVHFMDNGYGFRGRAYLDDPNVADTTKYTIGLSASSGGQVVKWASDLVFGTTYQMIVSYDYDSGESKLWIDPVDSNSVSLSDTKDAGTAIEALAFRQDYVSGNPNNAVYVNIAAIGNDFGSVLAATVVPEPSTLALGGFGVLALFLSRRRS